MTTNSGIEQLIIVARSTAPEILRTGDGGPIRIRLIRRAFPIPGSTADNISLYRRDVTLECANLLCLSSVEFFVRSEGRALMLALHADDGSESLERDVERLRVPRLLDRGDACAHLRARPNRDAVVATL